MYLEHFGLRELPFQLSPDPSFLYLSKNHARAKTYMESTIWFTDGFVIITGEVGSGKTTLIETFLREIDKDVVVAQVNQTQVSPVEFLQSVLVQFGFSPFKMKKAELLATLNQFLIEQYAAGRKVLLIIDEAQNLSRRVLEEVRMLSGVETTKEKVLRIILAGQPEMNAMLDSPDLVQLMQRVRLRFHLTALSEEDLRAYILHRLEVAGSHSRQIFTDETFPLIYRYTGGVPRLINTLCDSAMMIGYASERAEVGAEEILAAIEELGWTDFQTRQSRGSRHAGDAGMPGSHHGVARIHVTFKGQTVAERTLSPGRLVIGRTPDNDLQIDSKYISRHHCQIVTTADGSLVEDLNSTNGVYVKSRRIRIQHLNDGDVIAIGRHEILYIDQRTRKDPTSEHEIIAAPDDDDAPADS